MNCNAVKHLFNKTTKTEVLTDSDRNVNIFSGVQHHIIVVVFDCVYQPQLSPLRPACVTQPLFLQWILEGSS